MQGLLEGRKGGRELNTSSTHTYTLPLPHSLVLVVMVYNHNRVVDYTQQLFFSRKTTRPHSLTIDLAEALFMIALFLASGKSTGTRGLLKGDTYGSTEAHNTKAHTQTRILHT